jgi:hypothetical protein
MIHTSWVKKQTAEASRRTFDENESGLKGVAVEFLQRSNKQRLSISLMR